MSTRESRSQDRKNLEGCRLTSLGVVSRMGCGWKEHETELFTSPEKRSSPLEDSLSSWEYGESLLPCYRVTATLPEVPKFLSKFRSRNLSLALLALEQISGELERAKAQYGPHRIGVVVGSSTSGIEEAEKAFTEKVTTGALPSWYSYRQQEMGSVSEGIKKALHLLGPSYTVSTACSSSAKVFRSAQGLLEAGICDAVIVGGVDTLCSLTVQGFYSLGLVSSRGCLPMSKNRSGLIIGEGAALFLVERARGGVQLLGVGESSDAYHISSPDPSGRGAVIAMRQALERAGRCAHEVLYLNLHGTGTVHNDEMESTAVYQVFSDEVWCSSTKPLTGHTLGASGALEAAFLWIMLQREEEIPLPLHHYDGEYDESLPRLKLVEKPHVLLAPHDYPLLMSNSFGFGGNNCSLLLGREK